jgi:hypothetical protein
MAGKFLEAFIVREKHYSPEPPLTSFPELPVALRSGNGNPLKDWKNQAKGHAKVRAKPFRVSLGISLICPSEVAT